ncbi:MAG: CoA transferase [Archaeoglobaceae archaeon]|nr:CoA transferase [Archaeoglobaceae archaeon]
MMNLYLSDLSLKPEALENVRVLDLTNVVLGPAASDFLAEFGAEVIKVELPGVGDVMRYVTPWFFYHKNLSPGFEEQNHNKLHIAIDLRKNRGREIIYKLAKKCDVIIENFRPGTVDSWGIGYKQIREIKPDIIYLSLSGFGQWGRNALRVSYDATAQAESGMMYITGFPEREPIKFGAWLLDFAASITGAIAVIAALIYKKKTGKGQFIDISQNETGVRWMDWTWIYVGLTGKNRERCGNRDPAILPSGVYKCLDGFIAIVAYRDDEFLGLCKALNLDERYREFVDPLKRHFIVDELDKKLKDFCLNKKVKEIEEIAEKYGFVASKIYNSKDFYEDEHFRSRRTVWIYEDHLWGELAEVQAVKMSETPGRIKWTARPLGFDNEFVLTKILGMSLEEIKELEKEGVIGKWSERKGTRPPEDWDGRSGLFF